MNSKMYLNNSFIMPGYSNIFIMPGYSNMHSNKKVIWVFFDIWIIDKYDAML